MKPKWIYFLSSVTAFASVSLVLFAATHYYDDHEFPKLPIQVLMSDSVKNTYSKPIAEAMEYINSSVGITVYSFDQGRSVLPIVLRDEISTQADSDCENCVGFVLYSPKIMVLKKDMLVKDEGSKKLLIAHEFLHGLGFSHRRAKIDSLINPGPVLVEKMFTNLEYAKSIYSKLPEYDIRLIQQKSGLNH
jgi:hypothetical protein